VTRARGKRSRCQALLIDLTPLRRSRDFRLVVGGQLVSVLGSQMTAVAVPYQVYALTRSSLDVGLVSLTLVPALIVGAVVGGTVADAVDRRKLLIVVELIMAIGSAALALNSSARPALWPLFVFPGLVAGLAGFEDSALGAMVPVLVGRQDIAVANATLQALFQLGGVAGPAIAGLLVAGTGPATVYWVDAITFVVVALSVVLVSPQRQPRSAAPDRDASASGWLPALGLRPFLRSLTDGIRFVRGQQGIQGSFLIDTNATVLGMPRALFPALAANVFGGGAITLGLLYAAPGAGALLGAITTGWVGQVRRQGRAVVLAVVGWGLAISGFGLACWLAPVPDRAERLLHSAGLTTGDAVALLAGLVLLAAAGWADVISAVFRATIVQLATPDELRGRLTGLQTAVVTGGPRLGDAEAGLVASAFGPIASVVSGGLACVAGALLIAGLRPGFRLQQTPAPDLAGDTAADSAQCPASSAQVS
jgi:MFS family permease